MDPDIRRVLDRLGRQAGQERSGAAGVPRAERMLAITPETGELLNAMLRLMGAQSVLEIGTSSGYSAIWLAEAVMGRGGTVTTIERDPAKISRARASIKEAGVADHVTILEGEAAEVLGRLAAGGAGPYDMVFIDADKEGVGGYFDAVLPMTRVGGAIVTDNMLYPEKYRGRMAQYAAHVRATAGVRTITCPVGNGEEITVRTA